MEPLISLSLAGVRLLCSLRFPETAGYLRAALLDAPPQTGQHELVRVSDATWEDASFDVPQTPKGECNFLSTFCSEALLPHRSVLIHASAVRWQDRAWLLCGPSGIGKSTQTKTLQQLCPGEFSVICGDRPALQFCKDADSGAETILVHPSPWNGKEDWHGAQAAPLAGVILLRRGEDALTAFTPQQAAFPVYVQFLQTYERAEAVRQIAALATALLQTVPVWLLTADRLPDSTQLLLESVFQKEATP